MAEGAGQPDSDENDEPAAAGPGGDAALLSELKALRRQARAARHAYWFPLALFGLLTCASVPFYIQPDVRDGGESGPPLPVLGGYPGITTARYLGYYWLAALLVGLLATLLWYRWNARRVGVASPARGYVVTVAVLTAAALVLPLLPRLGGGWLWYLQPGDLMMRGTFPFVIIAAGLCALAWAERSRVLAVIAAVYAGSAVLASLYDVENVLFRLGWNPSPGEWRLTSLPNVLLPALVLLSGAAGAFAVQRHGRRRAARPQGSPGAAGARA